MLRFFLLDHTLLTDVFIKPIGHHFFLICQFLTVFYALKAVIGPITKTHRVHLPHPLLMIKLQVCSDQCHDECAGAKGLPERLTVRRMANMNINIPGHGGCVVLVRNMLFNIVFIKH